MDIITRKDALAQGLKRFRTGVPCRHGHGGERHTKDGKCVACVAALSAVRSKRWAENNPDRMKEKTAKWRAANPDAWKASNKASKQRHQAEYSAKQREKYSEDPKPFREAWARYYESSKPYHLARAADAGRVRRARKKGASGTHTGDDAKSLLISQGYRCAYCRADLRKKKRHLDHIMPLARGGSDDRNNLQWTCAPCNLSKGAKDPIDFARERGLLV